MYYFLNILTHTIYLLKAEQFHIRLQLQADFLSFLLQLYSENSRSERENKNK